ESLGAPGGLDLVHRAGNRLLVAAEAVHLGDYDRRNALRLTSLEVCLAVLEAEIDRETAVRAATQRRLAQVAPSDVHDAGLRCVDLRDHRFRIAVHRDRPGAHGEPADAADHARIRAERHDPAHTNDGTAGNEQLATPAPAELIAVAPRREFRPERLADAHQRRTVAKLRQPDVVGRHTTSRVTKQSLGSLDSLPALFERREVPALAMWTHDPQASLGGVKREAPSNRKGFQRLVGAKRLVAEKAGGVHGLLVYTQNSLQSVPQQLAGRSARPVTSWTPSRLVSCEITR